jgi:hypothetical protein
VRKTIAFVITTCLIFISAVAWVVAQQARSAGESSSIDEVLQAVRSDLQGDRASVIAKNVPMTAEQAAKFWPLYQTYQKEQNVIMDDQLKGIQRYVNSFDSLDDAGALALINAHFDRDLRMNELRKKWLAEFRTLVGTKVAVRVMQIDRRLSLAHQMAFAAQIPLVR